MITFPREGNGSLEFCSEKFTLFKIKLLQNLYKPYILRYFPQSQMSPYFPIHLPAYYARVIPSSRNRKPLLVSGSFNLLCFPLCVEKEPILTYPK